MKGGNFMKKRYVTPAMMEELFQANEYVAACWTIACARGHDGNSVESSGVTHGTTGEDSGCGYAKNQVISSAGNGLVKMTEVLTQQAHDLDCTITDNKWNPINLKESDVKIGETVYWTTSATDDSGRVWHHYGQVQSAGKGNANHS